MSEQFFENLVEFLPKHVSPRPSYLHATIVFVIIGLISYYLGGGINIDINKDDVESETVFSNPESDSLSSECVHIQRVAASINVH